MYILHKTESEGKVNYILESESQRIALSLNTNENTPDDTPNAHTIRFWAFAASTNMVTLDYQKSDEKGAIQAFRKILDAAKQNGLANLSDFALAEPRATKKAPAKATPKDKPQTG